MSLLHGRLNVGSEKKVQIPWIVQDMPVDHVYSMILLFIQIRFESCKKSRWEVLLVPLDTNHLHHKMQTSVSKA